MGASLSSAIKQDDVAAVAELVLQGKVADRVNQPLLFLNGRSLMHEACRRGNVQIVKLLVQAGGNPSLPDLKTRATPFLKASQYGHEAVVSALIAAGVDVNQTDKFGQTALHRACFHGHLKVVQALLAAGAAFDLPNVLGQTALMWAAGRGHAAIVEALLQAGAQINLADRNGNTALHRAAALGQTEAVEVLLDPQWGADLTRTNACERTAFSEALHHHHYELAAYLKKGPQIPRRGKQPRPCPAASASGPAPAAAAAAAAAAVAPPPAASSSARPPASPTCSRPRSQHGSGPGGVKAASCGTAVRRSIPKTVTLTPLEEAMLAMQCRRKPGASART